MPSFAVIISPVFCEHFSWIESYSSFLFVTGGYAGSRCNSTALPVVLLGIRALGSGSSTHSSSLDYKLNSKYFQSP